MSGSRKVLIVGGLALAAVGMLYGLYYALFIEHQTLDRMGASLTAAFVDDATGNMTQSQAALQDYGDTKYNYVRQVDAHSHWGGLAMLMIVLGVVFDRVAFSEHSRRWLALTLLLGSILFPLAVLLQAATRGGVIASALAAAGAALVTIALAGVTGGFVRHTI